MPYRLNDQILLMTTYVPDPAHLLRLMPRWQPSENNIMCECDKCVLMQQF